MKRALLLFAIAFAAVGLVSLAQQPDVKVEHAKLEEPKKPTLRFLRENRDFLRGQIDLLRQRVREQDGGAEQLSARDLLLRDLMAGIEAGEDSLLREEARMAQREFLESVGELGELEAQLDRLEQLLSAQRDRLARLEQDYVHRQQTALMVILEGMPSDKSPTSLVLSENDDRRWRISISAEQLRALREGGAAQLLHEFVEPRAMELQLFAEGEGFADWPVWRIPVEPQRDRLTLVRVDFSRPQRGGELPTEIWQR